MKSEKVVATSFIVSGGEMGERIRAFDWSWSSLGPLDSWPQSLRTAVNIVLQSPVPLVMLWGEEGIMLYNDAYSIFAGARHPSLLGSKVLEGWPEVADFNRNVMDKGLKGETLSYKDQQLTLYRNNKAEEVWMDLNYSPVMDESGKPAGVLAVVVETTQRVLAEQQRQQAEDRLQLAMSAAELVGTYNWHIQEDIFYSDARFAALFSVDPDKGEKGTSISDYLKGIHPEDIDRIQLAVQHTIETGEKYSQEYRLLQKDGSVRWIIARGECVYDENGKPWRFPGVVVDITELKLAEESLKNSEERFRALVNTMPQIAWTANPDGYLDWYNERWYEFTGFDKETGGDQSWLPILHPDDAQHCLDTWYASVQSGELYQIEYRFWDRKTEQWRWHLGRALPLKDSQGRILKWFGTCTDIHEQKSFEAALKESEARFRIMADASPNFVWTLSPDGHITYLNKAGLDFHNLADFQEFNGDAWLSNLHPDDVALTVQAVETALASQTYYCVEHRAKGKSKEYRWFLSTGNPSYLPNGELYGYVGSSVDITELKTAETELKLSEARFRAAVEAVNGVLWTNNAEGEMHGKQQGWESLTGQTYEEYQGYGWSNAVHPEDAQPTINAWTEAVKERKTFIFEHRVRCRDGEWRRFSIRAIPIVGSDGTVREWVGVHTDITEEHERDIEIQHANKLLSTISRIQSRFITEEDLWVLFADLVQDVLDLTDSKFGYIGEILYKETGEPYLVFRGLTNIAWNEETQKLYAQLQTVGLEFHSMDSLYGAGIRNGGSVVISNDPHHDPRGKGFPPGHPPVTAFMGLPIYGEGGRLIGQFAVANRPGGYSEAHANFLEPLLVTCSNIIESCRNNQRRKQSEEALKESEQRYQMLYGWEKKTREILLQIRQPLKIEDTFFTAVRVMAEAMNADRAFIVEFDETGQVLPVQYEYRRNESVKPFTGICPPWEFCPYLAQTAKKEQASAEDTWNDATVKSNPDWYQFSREYNIRGIITSPVVYQDRLINVLVLHTMEPRRWEDRELFYTNIVTNQLATSFYQAELFKKEQQAYKEAKLREKQQEVVAELGLKALSGIELQDLMDIAVDMVARTFEVEYCKILELLPGGEEVFLKAGVGWQEGLVGNATVSTGLDSQAGYTLISKEPVIVEELRSETRFSGPPLLHDHGVVSGLSLVIHTYGKPWGVMGTHATKYRKFTKHDVNFFQAIANVIAAAIERKQSEASLQESEVRFRVMADAAPNLVWMLDPKGSLTYMNDYGLRFIGVSLDKLIKDTWSPYVHPDDFETTSQLLQEAVSTRSAFRHEYRIKHNNGDYRWVLSSASPSILPNGELYGYIGSSIDIQDRKLAEQTILKGFERERLLRGIIETSSQTFDIDSILDSATEEIGKFYQVDRCVLVRYIKQDEELLPDTPHQYVSSSDVSLLSVEDMPFKAIPATGRKYQENRSSLFAHYTTPEEYLELFDTNVKNSADSVDREALREKFISYADKYCLKSGLGIEIHYRGYPYGVILLHQCKQNRIWQEGEITLLEHIAANMGAALYQAELYQAEQKARLEAEAANQKKSQFLANMSHELRTPLNAVIGYSSMMKQGIAGELTDKQEKYARNIEISGKHLLDMVNDILDVSKIEAGKIHLNFQLIELKSLMKDLEDVLNGLAEQKGVNLEFTIQPSLETIIADPARLRQIFFNLISNAIKFNKAEGEVTIRLSNDVGWMVAEVADTGIGIPRNKQSELFTEFYQVDASTSRSHEGTGLGLVLTKRLVELHGGEISFESEEGVGTTFTFKIPMTPSDRDDLSLESDLPLE